VNVKYKGEFNENFKNILLAHLVQIRSVQLCHFSTLSPFCSLHNLQHLTIDWIPYEKNPLAAGTTVHAPPLALLQWIRKHFHQEPPWVAQKYGNHKGVKSGEYSG
jgi:hypothetical protein